MRSGLSVDQRFESYIDRTPGCWIWTGPRNQDGYGRFHFRSGDKWATRVAHRISFEKAGGVVPNGLMLDHLCRNPSCVNPDHLEPVTNVENMRRGWYGRSLCIHGHPLDGLNTTTGHRRCKTCHRLDERRRRAERSRT